MNAIKEQAIAAMNKLSRTIPHAEYCTVMDGLHDIETLQVRDEKLEKLWAEFGDIPMDPETECIEEPFMRWGAGTHREEIWHWFDDRYSNGVAYLLYGGTEDYVPETKRLYGLSKLCEECESVSCQFVRDGLCRFPLVHERKPHITNEDGCLDYCLRNEDHRCR